RRELDRRVALRAGSFYERAARMGAVRVDAEPLQPPLSGGGARDVATLLGRRNWCHSVVPARAWAARGRTADRGARRHDARADGYADPFALWAGRRRRCVGGTRRGGGRTWRPSGRSGPRLVATQSSRDRADRRRHQAVAPGNGAAGGRAYADRR